MLRIEVSPRDVAEGHTIASSVSLCTVHSAAYMINGVSCMHLMPLLLAHQSTHAEPLCALKQCVNDATRHHCSTTSNCIKASSHHMLCTRCTCVTVVPRMHLMPWLLAHPCHGFLRITLHTEPLCALKQCVNDATRHHCSTSSNCIKASSHHMVCTRCTCVTVVPRMHLMPLLLAHQSTH
jgi:hypothetical protein